MPRVVLAPDKFRGTADAGTVAAAMAEAAVGLGWDVTIVPMSDGGEGFLDAAAVRCPHLASTTVTGPDGRPVEAEWRFGDGIAVVESARASGLALVGGAEGNDPVAATSRGTGELLVAAARQVGPGGTVEVGLGGSATTDGGLGAVRAVEEAGGLEGIRLVVACDVDVAFVDAARRFAPQKGAGPDQVAELTGRLVRVADGYRDRYGIDVSARPGAGAAGGLGGGLFVLGGLLLSGYQLVAELVGLEGALEGADRVVTGEGALDATSFLGKVVGGVVTDARGRGLPTLVVAGRCTPDGEDRARAMGCEVVSLSERFGPGPAVDDLEACIREATATWLGPAGG
ncbi:MAG TPA: glycerate kinase [Acidimicrobiales bacterium]